MWLGALRAPHTPGAGAALERQAGLAVGQADRLDGVPALRHRVDEAP